MNQPDVNSQDNPAAKLAVLVLSGIVVVLVALNVGVAWLFQESTPGNEWLELLIIGGWVFEPILFGIWAAFGSGSLVTRLPLVVPWLLILFIAPYLVDKTSLVNIERYEFITMVLAGLAIFVVAMLVCLALRSLAGCRIEQPSTGQRVGQSRIQFSMKYLLGTTTVYAVLLGIATRLTFHTKPPSLWPSFFGPDFYIYFFAVGGAAVSGVLLPIVAIPIFVLRPQLSQRAVRFAAVFWLVVTTLAIGILTYFESEDRVESHLFVLLEMFLLVLLLQLGAILVGLLVALPLRWVGFRLVVGSPADTHASAVSKAATP